jgi:Asp-tRNA(Asn)/Glu-tRNA(Gln) amidotransferase A subunit family amidase
LPSSEPRGDVHTDLAYLSAYDAGRLIERRDLSPVELTKALLERIDMLNPRLSAFLTIVPERAMADALAAEERSRRNERLGPLDGVPHSIKDVEPTEDIRTTSGSNWDRNRVPDHDSIVAERMRAAGSPLLGKTNTPHAGYKDMTDNLLGPASRNPWDLSRTPGGSSGGASAAVSAGLGALAQGGDGGGSLRIPASFTGTVGFKPSQGRVPMWPGGDWYGSIVSTKGPITRTVLDAALMLNALCGPDRRDPLCIDSPAPDFVAATSQSVRQLKVAWSPDLGHMNVEPDVAEACNRAAMRFVELGCQVTEVPITWGAAARNIMSLIWAVMYAEKFDARVEEHPEWIEPSLMGIIRDGATRGAVEFRRALSQRADLYNRVRGLFDDYDLLVTPTMPDTAWPVDREPETPLFDRVGFTCPFNLTGNPAVSVPCGFDRHGRPIGLQIVAGWHRDALALTAAARFEESYPWPIIPTGI